MCLLVPSGVNTGLVSLPMPSNVNTTLVRLPMPSNVIPGLVSLLMPFNVIPGLVNLLVPLVLSKLRQPLEALAPLHLEGVLQSALVHGLVLPLPQV